jgi:hypothetical protein
MVYTFCFFFFKKKWLQPSSLLDPTMSHFSTESEYKALANATVELIWIQSLLKELGGISLNCSYSSL